MPPQILGKCNERAGVLLAAEKASGSNSKPSWDYKPIPSPAGYMVLLKSTLTLEQILFEFCLFL